MTTVTDQTFFNLRSAISAATPPPKSRTVLEALRELVPVMNDAIASGHTVHSLVDVFAKQGVKTNHKTIASVLRAASTPKVKRPRKTKADPAQSCGGENDALLIIT